MDLSVTQQKKLEIVHMRTKCRKPMSYFNFACLVYAHAFNLWGEEIQLALIH